MSNSDPDFEKRAAAYVKIMESGKSNAELVANLLADEVGTDAAQEAATAGAVEGAEECLEQEVPRFIPPWFAQPDDDEDQDNGENYIVVSYCYSDENPIICVGHKHWPLDKDTATLISAAPELLEVAQMVLDTAAIETPVALIEAARNAIVKAVGEVADRQARSAVAPDPRQESKE